MRRYLNISLWLPSAQSNPENPGKRKNVNLMEAKSLRHHTNGIGGFLFWPFHNARHAQYYSLPCLANNYCILSPRKILNRLRASTANTLPE